MRSFAPRGRTRAASLLAIGATAALAAASMSARAAAPNPTVEMTVANRGKIVVELYPKEAPKTVAHFLDLVNHKFYDGILFHRVIPGFVAQAGDPASKTYTPQEVAAKDDGQGSTEGLGGGGSGKNIPFEENKLTNEPGTLAMALAGPRSATGDSQFFINLVPNHRLDGDYCVFGKVVKGMDVVKKLQRGDKITRMAVVKDAKESGAKGAGKK